MAVIDNIHRAYSRLQQDGFIELCYRVLNTGSNSILQKLLIHSNLLLSSDDLRTRCAPNFLWTLDQQAYEPIELLSFGNNKELQSVDDIREKTWTFKRAFVSELQQVTALGPYALPVTFDGKIVCDVIHWDPYSTSFPNHELARVVGTTVSALPFQFLKSLRPTVSIKPLLTVECACVVRGWQDMNYYSWILKHLARLRGVQRYEQETGNNVTLIIPPRIPTYAQETLRVLGYQSQCITWRGGSVQVDKLVVPSHPEPTPETIQWIQTVGRKLAPPTSQANEDTNKWIYISRQGAGRRRLENFGEIKPIFERYGVTPIRCEELSLDEQIREFREADGVIGIHGAGLTNIIWGESLSVIEIFNNAGKTVYRNLSDVMGHKYDHILANPTGNADSKINDNITLDPDKLATTIQSLQT